MLKHLHLIRKPHQDARLGSQYINMNDTENVTQSSAPAFQFYPEGYFVLTEKQLDDARFAFYVILNPLTALFGVGGNISSFFILVRKTMRTTQNLILLALSITDTLHLLATLFHSISHIMTYFNKQEGNNFINAAYPYFGAYLYHVWGRISALLTVCITIERLIAVIMPLKVKMIWTKKVTVVCIFLSYCIPAIIMATQIFEYEALRVYFPNSTDYKVSLVLTDLGRDRVLFTYLYNANMTILRYMPIFIVCLANLIIISGLWYQARKRKHLKTGSESTISSTELKITRTLVLVSVVFFVSSAPGTTLFIIQNLDPEYNFPFFRNNIYVMALIVSLWLEVLNSSINFEIYVATNSKFRTLYCEMLPCCGKVKKRHVYIDSEKKPTTISVLSED